MKTSPLNTHSSAAIGRFDAALFFEHKGATALQTSENEKIVVAHPTVVRFAGIVGVYPFIEQHLFFLWTKARYVEGKLLKDYFYVLPTIAFQDGDFIFFFWRLGGWYSAVALSDVIAFCRMSPDEAAPVPTGNCCMLVADQYRQLDAEDLIEFMFDPTQRDRDTLKGGRH